MEQGRGKGKEYFNGLIKNFKLLTDNATSINDSEIPIVICKFSNRNMNVEFEYIYI